MPKPPFPVHLEHIHKLKRQLQKALQKGVSENVFSGAQASFCVDANMVHTVIAGTTAYDCPTPIKKDTLFDIASLTKVFTTTCTLKLVEQDTLSLTKPFKHQIALAQSQWNDLTPLHLLSHESGLPSWKPYYASIPITIMGTPKAYHQIVHWVLCTAPEHPLKQMANYSDLNFIGLGYILSELTQTPLERLIQKHVIDELTLPNTLFCPPMHTRQHIAATENCPWRKVRLQGDVHDDNAYAMGGVAGHAGLFSTSRDVCYLGVEWLKSLSQSPFLSKQLATLATTRRPMGRGLGFDFKTGENSSVGKHASYHTFGHLGFTGTSLWINPQSNAVISLLTNRVHPTRDNVKIREFRPYFHNLFFKHLS